MDGYIMDTRRFAEGDSDAFEVTAWAATSLDAEDLACGVIPEGDWQCVDVTPHIDYSRHSVWAVTFYAISDGNNPDDACPCGFGDCSFIL